MRVAMIGWMVLALLLVGLSIGRASENARSGAGRKAPARDELGGVKGAQPSDKDEAVITAQVTSADHELDEGYFTLGDNATVVAKPGSDLYRFLARQRGHKIKMVLTETGGPELSKLVR